MVTDPPLFELGVANQVIEKLVSLGIQPKAFTNVEPDPTLGMVTRALQELRSFKPDVIIAIGGGSPMDAAKLMWLVRLLRAHTLVAQFVRDEDGGLRGRGHRFALA